MPDSTKFSMHGGRGWKNAQLLKQHERHEVADAGLRPGLVSRHRTLRLGSVRVELCLDKRALTASEISN